MSRITVFFDHIRNACRQEGLPLEEVAAKLTEAGISGTEIEYQELLGEEGKALADRLAGLGLPVSSVYCNFHWESKKNMVDYREVCKRLQELGIHNLLVIPGFTNERKYHAPKRDNGITGKHLRAMNRFLPKIRTLCEEARDKGILVIMEDFDLYKAPFGRAEELKWFFDRIPLLGCAFDTGNFLYFGEDSYEVLGDLKGRIAYVHCKDRSLTPVEGEDHCTTVTGQDLYSSPVGSGVIRMTKILTEIKGSGYDGTYAIEHFGSLHQLPDSLQSAEYLREILK